MNRMHSTLGLTASLLLAVFMTASPVSAQIEENLGSFTGDNTQGYLEPLKDALGSGLADGLFMSAHIPETGFHARLDIRAMLIGFSDEDRTFQGTTEFFPDAQTVKAPTVIGDTGSVSATDPGTNAVFTFPGGLDISRLGLAVPQIVVSGKGTEAILRYIALDVGDNEIGDISLFGIGARHSISRYLDDFPVELAAMLFYQSLDIGEDFISSSHLNFGVQASKRYRVLEPYGGLALDSYGLDVTYASTGGPGDDITVEFDRDNNLHLTLGTAAHFGPLHLNGELNIAAQTSWTFGLAVGM